MAVFENIISFAIDLWGFPRKKAVICNVFAIILLSLPCILGFNVLSGFQPLGPGTNIMDLEDFLVSSNLLPLGSLCYVLFCTTKHGWGWDNFIHEANAGNGLSFPAKMRYYITWGLPLIIVVIYLKGYYDLFAPKGLRYLIPWMCIAAAFLAFIFWIAASHSKKQHADH